MFERLKAWWQARRFANAYPDFPQKVEGHAHCISWHLSRAEANDEGKESRSDYFRWPVEGKFLFNPHKVFWNDNSGRVGELVPAFRFGDKVGLYRQVGELYYGQGTGGHSDWASWDDGKKGDWELVEVVDASEVPCCQDDFYIETDYDRRKREADEWYRRRCAENEAKRKKEQGHA